MWLPAVSPVVVFMTSMLGASAWDLTRPDHFDLYYSGPPCEQAPVDRTFSSFQVNLNQRLEYREGRLSSGLNGEALLVAESGRVARLVSNASRMDWMLSYPFMDTQVGVWGQAILEADCTISRDQFYARSIFPTLLLQQDFDRRLDIDLRPEAVSLAEPLDHYRSALRHGQQGAVIPLERAIFSPDLARDPVPWRALLLESDGPPAHDNTLDILLSGADGATGMFGHIAVGSDGLVYNVYPKGSERGDTSSVPLGDYLFNAQRGQALRRPNWILRLRGLEPEVLAAFHTNINDQIRAISSGETPYHPTANNCTTASLAALQHIGISVPRIRIFSRRFPRPIFERILTALPYLVASEKLSVSHVELIFIPQVSTRPLQGGAPNRPVWDRSKLDHGQQRKSR